MNFGPPARIKQDVPRAAVGRRLIAQLAFYAVNSAGAYVALNVLLFLAAPVLKGWSVAAATAVTVPPMVVIMVHTVVPLAARAKTRILVQR